DAMKVVADYPLLGAGGGGWSVLYEQYQNNPYISRQAHSFFVQTMVEVGILGFIALIALILVVFYRYLKHYWSDRDSQPEHFVFFILALSLLAHSAVDFDMSYMYYAGVVFFTLGVLGGTYKDITVIPKFSKLNNSRSARVAVTGILACLSLLLLVQVYQELVSTHLYKQSIDMAVRERKPLQELLIPLEKAIDNS